jgi:hypothetical protein
MIYFRVIQMWSYAVGVVALASLISIISSLGTSVVGTKDSTYLPYIMTQFLMVSAYIISGTAISAGNTVSEYLHTHPMTVQNGVKLPVIRKLNNNRKFLFTLLGMSAVTVSGLYDIRFAWFTGLLALLEILFVSTLNTFAPKTVFASLGQSNKLHSKWAASWASNLILGAILVTGYHYLINGNLIAEPTFQLSWFYCLYIMSVITTVSAWYAAPFFVYFYYFYAFGILNYSSGKYTTSDEGGKIRPVYKTSVYVYADGSTSASPINYQTGVKAVSGFIATTSLKVNVNSLHVKMPTTGDYYLPLGLSTLLLGVALYAEPKLTESVYQSLLILGVLGLTFMVYYKYGKDLLTQWTNLDLNYSHEVTPENTDLSQNTFSATIKKETLLAGPVEKYSVSEDTPTGTYVHDVIGINPANPDTTFTADVTPKTIQSGDVVPNSANNGDVTLPTLLLPVFDTRRNLLGSFAPFYFIQTYILYWLGHFYPDVSVLISLVALTLVIVNDIWMCYIGSGLLSGFISSFAGVLKDGDAATTSPPPQRSYGSYLSYMHYSPDNVPTSTAMVPPSSQNKSLFGYLATLQWVPNFFNVFVILISRVGITFLYQSLGPYFNPILDTHQSVFIFASFVLGMYLIVDTVFGIVSGVIGRYMPSKDIFNNRYFGFVISILILVGLMGLTVSGHTYLLSLDTPTQHSQLPIFIGFGVSGVAAAYGLFYAIGSKTIFNEITLLESFSATQQ